MDIKPQYQDQVKLLVDVLPFVAQETCFALKGGTAINLFEWDLPRLSVDIDLTYLPMQGRQDAVASISQALGRLKNSIEGALKQTRVTLVKQQDGLEAKLHCQRLGTQIKARTIASCVAIFYPPGPWPVRKRCRTCLDVSSKLQSLAAANCSTVKYAQHWIGSIRAICSMSNCS